MSTKMIFHPCGLGDHYVCSGLVRKFYNEVTSNLILFCCNEYNAMTVIRLYQDLPSLKIMCFKSFPEFLVYYSQLDAQTKENIIKLGDQLSPIPPSLYQYNWSELPYAQCGYDYSVSLSNFRVWRNENTERLLYNYFNPTNEKYILVSDMSSAGKEEICVKSGKKIIYIQRVTDNALDWLRLIENAEEIHCFDSSFLNLVDRLSHIPEQKCFLHKCKTKVWSFIPKLFKNWNRVGFEQ